MDWKLRSTYKNVLDAVTDLSGLSEEELLNPNTCAPSDIQNMTEAADVIRSAVTSNMPISIMGDYDADGITSSSILYCTLRKMGVTPYVRLPRRFSEGYGLSIGAVDEFKPGLLITVDNGISAVDAIQAAKDKGMTVVIIDHHLPPETLPCADVIVDPHVAPNKNGFVDYCGAGLSYKLAQLLFAGDELFLKQMESLAAIGTVADSMPLVGDNRIIVRNGLASMANDNRRSLIPGLQALLTVAEVYDIDEHDIGFKIGPMLNAAGRLLDDGAFLSFQTLTAETTKDGTSFAEQLRELNERRKTLTAETEQVIEDIIRDECLFYDRPMCVFAEGIPEGIVGILTGRIAEKYKTPAFLFTNSEDPDVYKGSGRSFGGYNLMDVVNAAEPHLLRSGGHAGAAGLTVSADKYGDMMNAMRSVMEDYEAPEANTLEYDLAIDADEVSAYYKQVKKYAPYGEGVPRPIFLVRDIVLSPRMGQPAKYMGKKLEHVKMYGRGYSAICFGRAEEYRDMGCPINLDIVGELSMNVFRYSSELQIEVTDFRVHQKAATGRASSLMEALRLNGTI